jgi:hypothetical protein
MLANGYHAIEEPDHLGADEEVRFAPVALDHEGRAAQLAAKLSQSERARAIALCRHAEQVEDDLAAAQARVEGLISEVFGTTLAGRIEEARRVHDRFLAEVICLHETLDPPSSHPRSRAK